VRRLAGRLGVATQGKSAVPWGKHPAIQRHSNSSLSANSISVTGRCYFAGFGGPSIHPAPSGSLQETDEIRRFRRQNVPALPKAPIRSATARLPEYHFKFFRRDLRLHGVDAPG